MDYGRITTEYLCYLMNRIGLEAEGDDGYLHLCTLLQGIAFRPRNDMDANRCEECRELRRDFEEHEDMGYGIPAADILDGALPEDGTMLELLTVLSERMRFELSDSVYEASPRKWFLEMIANCGLSTYCTNEDLERDGCEDLVKDTIAAVIDRAIGWDGEGGFFPLRYPDSDQRRLELIIQMNNYLAENYDIC